MNNSDIIKWTYCDLYHYFDEMTDACNDFLCCLVFPISDVTFARQADSFIESECLTTYVIFFFHMVVNTQLFNTLKLEKRIMIILPCSFLTIEKLRKRNLCKTSKEKCSLLYTNL